jgi:hypothetical protein
MTGNLVHVTVGEDGKRRATSTKARFNEKEPMTDVVLVPGLPNPPTQLAADPGKGARHHFFEGPRRPSFGLISPGRVNITFMARKHSSNKRLRVMKWLSSRQLRLWDRQVGCPYCGVGVGIPCVSRTIRWGETNDFGLPSIKQRPAPYQHSLRVKALQPHYARLAWEIFPDWIWWSMHAIGEDKDALMAALVSARGLDFALEYLSAHRTKTGAIA